MREEIVIKLKNISIEVIQSEEQRGKKNNWKKKQKQKTYNSHKGLQWSSRTSNIESW